MEIPPKNKLDRIAQIWEHFIRNYRFCNNRIKFNDDLRTNYFGDILNYFSDTFSLLENQYESDNFQDNFRHSISFLQSVYIQQDFIEEMHFIFKTGIVKGDLKSDRNYSKNREIRNESIGHPIRKTVVSETSEEIERCPTCGGIRESTKNKEVLLSSILFSSEIDSENISYLKYHRDNKFKFEVVSFSKKEILGRHYTFLNQNFDKIINGLKKILRKFLKKLKEIDRIKNQIPIENLVRLLSDSFENIFETDYLFKPKILLELSKRKDEHPRYKVGLESFFEDLGIFLKESREEIEEFLDDKDMFSNPNYFEGELNFEIEFVQASERPKEQNVSYTYELGKLADKERGERFDFFISSLEKRCKENKDAINEINHLKTNKYDDLEYYSAYKMLRKILKAD